MKTGDLCTFGVFPRYLFPHSFLHFFNREETWLQRVLRGKAASRRTPENSVVIGPWLSCFLLKWPVLAEELQELPATGGVTYPANRAGPQTGTQVRV